MADPILLTALTPQTEVRLLSGVPLDNNYHHQLYFTSQSAQTTYFQGKTARRFTDFKYLRKDRAIRVPINVEQLYNCNYVMYRNSNFSNKWFYAFITELYYVAQDATDIVIETDCYQTWLFDINIKPSFVEREHRPLWNSDGTPVINTVDEGLNYGNEYRVTQSTSKNFYGKTGFMLLACKDYIHKLPNDQVSPYTSVIGGVPSSLFYYLVPFDKEDIGYSYSYNGFSLMHFREFYHKLTTNEKLVGKCVSISFPDFVPLIDSVNNDSGNITGRGISIYNLADDLGLTGSIMMIGDSTTFAQKTLAYGDKYTGFPSYSESKMLMYPYSYTLITDFKGHEFIVKNEYVNQRNLDVVAKGCINATNKTAYYVKGYQGTNNIRNGIINDADESMVIVDDYTASYMQSNRNSLIVGTATNLAGSVMSLAGSVATGNMLGLAGSIGSGIGTIAGLMAKYKDIDNIPSNSRSQGNNALFDIGNDYVGVWAIKFTTTQEYANKLQGFWKMYGYKVNEVKVPNLYTRQSWNYVKTVDITIEGDVIESDLNRIKKMFNDGVTLWHGDYVGDYSRSNNPI